MSGVWSVECRAWRGGLVAGLICLVFFVTAVYAQEPTPTPRATATPIPTSTPVATPQPTPQFNSGNPVNFAEGIVRSLTAARNVATTIRSNAGTSLIGKTNEFGNDMCTVVGVLYGGQSIFGSYLTTTLISVAGAMLVISLIRIGLWVVKFIMDIVRIL